MSEQPRHFSRNHYKERLATIAQCRVKTDSCTHTHLKAISKAEEQLSALSNAEFRPIASSRMRDVQVLAYSREIIRGNPEPSGDRCHRFSPNQRVEIVAVDRHAAIG